MFAGFYSSSNGKGRLTGLGPVIYNCDGVWSSLSNKAHHSSESRVKDEAIEVPELPTLPIKEENAEVVRN